MGSKPSEEDNSNKITNIPIYPEPTYQIPELQTLIKKAFRDLNGRDPMGKRLYLNQILNFILDWLPR